MAEVQPFRGLRYDVAAAGAIDALIAPPYDVISPEIDPLYRERSPHNVIHVELPRAGDAGDRYQQAAAILDRWRREGVLRFDDLPAVYIYGQTYALPGGGERTRCGVLALLRLEEYEAGVVLPHEQTFPKHKEDRFRLLSACGTQISPIFGLYHAPDGEVGRWVAELGDTLPAADATDREGVRHRLWPVTDRARLDAWRQELAPLQVFIADGHHRYETALRYRAERRSQADGTGPAAHDYVMTLLVEMADPGLVLFPTHRLLHFSRAFDGNQARDRLANWFDVRSVTTPPAAEIEALLTDAGGRLTLGMLAPPGDRLELWSLRDATAVDRVVPPGRSEAWRRLDVVALHALVLDQCLGLAQDPDAFTVSYTRDPAEAIQSVRQSSDTSTVAFFTRAPSIEDVRSVALAGEKMPEKSTYFWPKAVTGMVLYDSGGFVADL